ncbi:MAG: sodium/proline symporter, partial [Polyangiaceae bacterium]|nr:sodium/proline symporter [Polyangiaceae bacterium]
AALSAVATNNSGFMFVGLLGFAYAEGLKAAWLQLGWVLGDIVIWYRVYSRARARSGKYDAKSIPMLLATRDDGTVDRPIVVAAGLLTLVFLGVYAAAQLNAGSVALEAIFGFPSWTGAVLGAIVVAAYSYAGGLRASIWTDAAQAVVMLGAMLILVGTATSVLGGPSSLYAALASIDPSLVEIVPRDLPLGFALLMIGYIGGGIAIAGQPHVVVRALSLDSVDEIPSARRVYFSWYIPFSILSIAAGLYARAMLPELDTHAAGVGSTAEMALPELSRLLLPEVLVGLVLAGLFAASMSTADSQILACSAAITQDLAPQYRADARASKLATLAI